MGTKMGKAKEEAGSGEASTDPLVSVIIPFYNRKRFIGDCLTSVLASSLKNIEIICVDDGSTDDTVKHIRRFARNDKRVKVVKAEHMGPYGARWVGLRRAKGEYVHFMDSDDTIDANAYEECYRTCKENNLDYLVFLGMPFASETCTKAEEECTKKFEQHYHLEDECCNVPMTGLELMRKLITAKCFYVAFHMRLIRRDVIPLDELNLCNALYHADNFYSVYWLYKARRAMAVQRKYYNRRVHKDSITLAPQTSAQHVKSMFQVILAFCRFNDFSCTGYVSKSIEEIYMLRQVRGMIKRRDGMTFDEVAKIVAETVNDEEVDAYTFMQMCFMPMMALIAKHEKPKSRRVYITCAGGGK